MGHLVSFLGMNVELYYNWQLQFWSLVVKCGQFWCWFTNHKHEINSSRDNAICFDCRICFSLYSYVMFIHALCIPLVLAVLMNQSYYRHFTTCYPNSLFSETVCGNGIVEKKQTSEATYSVFRLFPLKSMWITRKNGLSKIPKEQINCKMVHD